MNSRDWVLLAGGVLGGIALKGSYELIHDYYHGEEKKETKKKSKKKKKK